MVKKSAIILVLALLIPLAYAASIDVAESYGPSEILSGTITLKLVNESADSNLTAKFDSISRNIRLIDFLNNASADYSCIPDDC